jgi:cell division protein ZapD
MSGGKTIQMLRVTLPSDLPVVPELSANRYAINVRFIQPSTSGDRTKVVEADIEFALSYCNL